MIGMNINEMVSALQNALNDADKFDRGNDTAGTRLRKALADVRDKAQSTRLEIIQVRKERREISKASGRSTY